MQTWLGSSYRFNASISIVHGKHVQYEHRQAFNRGIKTDQGRLWDACEFNSYHTYYWLISILLAHIIFILKDSFAYRLKTRKLQNKFKCTVPEVLKHVRSGENTDSLRSWDVCSEDKREIQKHG